ncbi:MAG: HEAT repeat domain-containing protein [Parvibaculaceae bacterium]
MFHISRENDARFIAASFGSSREGLVLSHISDMHWRLLSGSELREADRALMRSSFQDPSAEVWTRAGLAACRLAALRRDIADDWLALARKGEQQTRLRYIRLLDRMPVELGDAIVQVLAEDPDPLVRLALIERLGEIGKTSAKEILRTLAGHETAPDVRTAIRSAQSKIAARHRRHRSAQVFDWERMGNGLLRYVEQTLNCLSQEYQDTVFDAGALDCNAEYGQVLVSFNAASVNGPSSEPDRWDIGAWSHCDAGQLLVEREPFEANLWEAVARKFAEKLWDQERLWAEGENPRADFVQMATLVAGRIVESPSMARLKRTSEFEFIAVDHDEDVDDARARAKAILEARSGSSTPSSNGRNTSL